MVRTPSLTSHVRHAHTKRVTQSARSQNKTTARMCPHHSLASPMMFTLTSPPQTQRPDTTRSHSPHSSGMRCSGSDCRCAWSDLPRQCGAEQHRGPTRAPRLQDDRRKKRKTAQSSPENTTTISLPFTHAAAASRTTSHNTPARDTRDAPPVHISQQHTPHPDATNSHRTHHRNTNAHHQSTQVTHKPAYCRFP